MNNKKCQILSLKKPAWLKMNRLIRLNSWALEFFNMNNKSFCAFNRTQQHTELYLNIIVCHLIYSYIQFLIYGSEKRKCNNCTFRVNRFLLPLKCWAQCAINFNNFSTLRIFFICLQQEVFRWSRITCRR